MCYALRSHNRCILSESRLHNFSSCFFPTFSHREIAVKHFVNYARNVWLSRASIPLELKARHISYQCSKAMAGHEGIPELVYCVLSEPFMISGIGSQPAEQTFRNQFSYSKRDLKLLRFIASIGSSHRSNR